MSNENRIAVRIDDETKEYLDKLPESMSVHIREAVRKYTKLGKIKYAMEKIRNVEKMVLNETIKKELDAAYKTLSNFLYQINNGGLNGLTKY